jgi:hypothetical protein
MPTVTYHDLTGEAPRVKWGAYTFIDGNPVFVDDESLVSKARENRFFEVADDAKAALKALAPSFEPVQAEVAVDDERNALIKEAEGLGIDVDKRWGVKRLESEISAAKIKALG